MRTFHIMRFALIFTVMISLLHNLGPTSSQRVSAWQVAEREGELVWAIEGEGAQINAIALDSEYIYVVGVDSSWQAWRIEKRYKSNGSLVSSFGDNGVIITRSGDYAGARATDIAIDRDFMYIVGWCKPSFGSYGAYIQKRSLDSGLLVWEQFGGGSMTYEGVAIDSNYIYIVGEGDPGSVSYNHARIEKRYKSDGSLVYSFGEGGFVRYQRVSGSNPINKFLDVAVDDNYIYATGFTSWPHSFVFKVDKTTGQRDLDFGWNGILELTPSDSKPYAVVIDQDFGYVAAAREVTERGWRVCKFRKSDGEWVSAFGSYGCASFDGPGREQARAIVLDGNSLYVAGGDSNTTIGDYQWRIEKRKASDGSLEPSFGEGGAVTINPTEEADLAFAIAVDQGHIYTAGSWWRVEKRAIDKTAPAVLSSVRLDPSPTSAASVRFRVTFSEVVTGVDAADFALATIGGISGAAVTGVEGTGAVYTITVGTGSGSGTLRLDVPVTASIADLAGNPLTGLPYTSGESYAIDKTAPAVLSSVRLDPSPTSAASVRFRVTFSEVVTDVDTADFSLTVSGVTGASVTGVEAMGAAYTVTVSTGSGSGILRLDVPATVSITDLAGNPLTGLPYTGGEAYMVRLYFIHLPLVLRNTP